MKTLAIIAFCLIPAHAWAQSHPQRTFTLQVTEADIAAIGQGLETLPYKTAAPVIERLRAQIAEQLKQPKTPDPVPEQK